MIKSFEINRSTWRNGNHGKGATRLLNEEGYMCCLGCFGKALDIEDSKLLNVPSPSYSIVKDSYPPKLFDGSNHYSPMSYLIQTNDSGTCSDEQRENLIKLHFKKYLDIDVTFTGKYND